MEYKKIDLAVMELKSKGLHGCDILRLIKIIVCRQFLSFTSFESVSEALSHLGFMIDSPHKSASIDDIKRMAITAHPIQDLPKILLEKKPRYIRQQHKLAQRHYRRK